MAHILIVRSLCARNDGILTAAETVIAYAPVHDTDPVGILWALRNLVACLVLGHLEKAGITLTGVTCLVARAYLHDTGTMAADARFIAVIIALPREPANPKVDGAHEAVIACAAHTVWALRILRARQRLAAADIATGRLIDPAREAKVTCAA